MIYVNIKQSQDMYWNQLLMPGLSTEIINSLTVPSDHTVLVKPFRIMVFFKNWPSIDILRS